LISLKQEYVQGIDYVDCRPAPKDQRQETGKTDGPSIKELEKKIADLEQHLKKNQNLLQVRKCDVSLKISGSRKEFKFYTGHNEEKIDMIFSFLDLSEPLVPTKNKISAKDQLILTLIRYRQNLSYSNLSFRFGIALKAIRKINITYTQLMYSKFKELEEKMFCPRDHHHPLPRVFKNPLLSNTRIVIDCTEFLCEKPENFKHHTNMYSNYKSHCTIKALIGVAPSGACMFCSDAYEGAISDRKIVEKSNFCRFLNQGDVVLADRGFTIEDLCLERGATLVIPPFLNSKKEFSAEEIARGKLIARARIHVERYNQRIKQYKILKGIIPISLMNLFSQILFVICCLVNFEAPLLKK
jgi:hypothetical protein